MKVTIHDPKDWNNTWEADLGDVRVESGPPVRYPKDQAPADQAKKRKRAPGGGRKRKVIAIPADQLPEQPYFTVPEVAAITGYHVRTIQARLRDGTLAGKKLGKEWHIYRDALLAKEG